MTLAKFRLRIGILSKKKVKSLIVKNKNFTPKNQPKGSTNQEKMLDKVGVRGSLTTLLSAKLHRKGHSQTAAFLKWPAKFMKALST